MKVIVYTYKELNPDDELHKKHTRVYKMCKKEGVSLPEETAKFFRVKPHEVDKVTANTIARIPVILEKLNFDELEIMINEEIEIDLAKYDVGDKIYIEFQHIPNG